VRVGVGQRAKSVVILLTGGIPKGKFDMLSIDFNIGNIIFEDGWDVDLEENTGKLGSTEN
jgi:hypothetical protein